MNLLSLRARAMALVLCAACVAPAWAEREVGGVHFEDQLDLAGQALVLNGVGLRVKMIVKVYAVGLYVGHKAGSPAGLLDQDGAKSVRIVMLRDVSPEQLNEALVQGIVANAAAAEVPGLHERLEALEAAILRGGEAHKGSLVQIDYLPQSGTRLSLAGKVLTAQDIPGADFYRALLAIWLGEQPTDRSLKRGLLGSP